MKQKQFKDMTRPEQGELLAAYYHGEPLEYRVPAGGDVWRRLGRNKHEFFSDWEYRRARTIETTRLGHGSLVWEGGSVILNGGELTVTRRGGRTCRILWEL